MTIFVGGVCVYMVSEFKVCFLILLFCIISCFMFQTCVNLLTGWSNVIPFPK